MTNNEWIQSIVAHKNAATKLGLHLDGDGDLREFDTIRTGSDGRQNPVLIVTLLTDPAPGWNVPFREFEGFPVVWKVNGKVFAL